MPLRGRSITSHDIDRYRDWFQVVGIHAAPVTTQMIEGQTPLNRADKFFPDHSVRAKCPAINLEFPVTVRASTAEPLPAVAFGVNLAP